MADTDSIKQRWSKVDDLVERWLAERQDLISQYCTAKQLDIFKEANALDHFCEILVDYVSAGHFEVFDELIREAMDFDDTDSIKVAENLYPEISNSTQIALEFNDKYQAGQSKEDLVVDLAAVGDVLANRFALEDRLIKDLHTSHEARVA